MSFEAFFSQSGLAIGLSLYAVAAALFISISMLFDMPVSDMRVRTRVLITILAPLFVAMVFPVGVAGFAHAFAPYEQRVDHVSLEVSTISIEGDRKGISTVSTARGDYTLPSDHISVTELPNPGAKEYLTIRQKCREPLWLRGPERPEVQCEVYALELHAHADSKAIDDRRP